MTKTIGVDNMRAAVFLIDCDGVLARGLNMTHGNLINYSKNLLDWIVRQSEDYDHVVIGSGSSRAGPDMDCKNILENRILISVFQALVQILQELQRRMPDKTVELDRLLMSEIECCVEAGTYFHEEPWYLKNCNSILKQQRIASKDRIYRDVKRFPCYGVSQDGSKARLVDTFAHRYPDSSVFLIDDIQKILDKLFSFYKREHGTLLPGNNRLILVKFPELPRKPKLIINGTGVVDKQYMETARKMIYLCHKKTATMRDGGFLVDIADPRYGLSTNAVRSLLPQGAIPAEIETRQARRSPQVRRKPKAQRTTSIQQPRVFRERREYNETEPLKSDHVLSDVKEEFSRYKNGSAAYLNTRTYNQAPLFAELHLFQNDTC